MVGSKKKPLFSKKALSGVKVKGFKASAVSCGIKGGKNKDLALISADAPVNAAAVFTKNLVKAAPVLLSQKRISRGKASCVVVNSGNANVSAGKRCAVDALKMTKAVEKELGIAQGEALVASTGIIARPLPIKKIEIAVPKLVAGLKDNGWAEFAEAIMTTDAFHKASKKSFKLGSETVTVLGIAKGAGMICPDMATMLAFVMTDVSISSAQLRRSLKKAVDTSFNRATVDGDTSTNDTVVIMASGKSKVACKPSTIALRKFENALNEVSMDLTRQIVLDGEGATKLANILVKGARVQKDAELVARTVASSQLVKTALYGNDPNWGRIIAAAGRSGVLFDPEKTVLKIGPVVLYSGGKPSGREKEALRFMKKREVDIVVDLKRGKASFGVITSDLSVEYVKINAEYTT
ncbi:MAG: bifunctional glutamate N-acetyltransferase/amino-acid acetyltransferase ArgJ [Deltaproteobacteria bacterium]|nr:bifunctional glutamate N-acetyltransferase/amino-acid acetyltransferase ArgJ [Deltaproteobacteria bacterium]